MEFQNRDDFNRFDDERLLALVAAGDERCLAILMRRYSPRLLRIAYRILHDEEEASDVVQEIFQVVYETAGRFDLAKGNFAPWALRIARNRALKRKRYLEARRFYANLSLDDLKGLTMSETVLNGCRFAEQEKRFFVDQALALLSPAQRMAVKLRILEGLPTNQVAVRTGRPIHFIENALSRAVKKLRRLIGEKASGNSAGSRSLYSRKSKPASSAARRKPGRGQT